MIPRGEDTLTGYFQSIDDDVTLQSTSAVNQEEKMKVIPRWPSRVFATEIVQRLMSVCESERAHIDLALAKELQVSLLCPIIVMLSAFSIKWDILGVTNPCAL